MENRIVELLRLSNTTPKPEPKSEILSHAFDVEPGLYILVYPKCFLFILFLQEMHSLTVCQVHCIPPLDLHSFD